MAEIRTERIENPPKKLSISGGYVEAARSPYYDERVLKFSFISGPSFTHHYLRESEVPGLLLFIASHFPNEAMPILDKSGFIVRAYAEGNTIEWWRAWTVDMATSATGIDKKDAIKNLRVALRKKSASNAEVFVNAVSKIIDENDWLFNPEVRVNSRNSRALGVLEQIDQALKSYRS